MSRLGKIPVPVPAGVTVTVADRAISVKGPKGELAWSLPEGIRAEAPAGGPVKLTRAADDRHHRARHGLSRALVANMVRGVAEGYMRKLQIVGVGYQAKKEGTKLVLQVGFADPVGLPIPPGVEVDVGEKGLALAVRGCDKQKVGEFAAVVRRVRPPEPYKGKGIRYDDEVVRRKAGKTLVAGGEKK